MTRSRFFACLLFLCCALCSLFAQAQRFPFFNCKVENGLAQSQVTSLAQDNFGNLWMGTLGGISRFDGKRIKNYARAEGLASNTVLDVLRADNNKLYVATAAGLQLYDGKHFLDLKAPDGRAVSGVTHLADGGHFVYAVSVFGVFAYNKHAGDNALPVALNLRQAAFLLYRDNVLMSCNKNGQVFFWNEEDLKNPFDSAGATTPVNAYGLFSDSKKRLWMYTDKGLFLRAGNGFKAFAFPGAQGQTFPVISMCEDTHGQLWLGAYSGAFRINDTSTVYFNDKNGFTKNIVYRIICDREGNIWAATDGEGVFRYSGGPFVSIDENSGLQNKQITGITGTGTGTIFLSSYQGRIAAYDVRDNTLRNIDLPLMQNDLSCMVWQADKGLVLGTRTQGLFFYKDGRVAKVYPDTRTAQQTSILSVLASGENLFALTESAVIRVGKAKTIERFPAPGARLLSACILQSDSLVLFTSNGLQLFAAGQFYKLPFSGVQEEVHVQCMQYANGLVYLGTTDRGILVCRLSDGSVRPLGRAQGLPSDFIYNMLRDEAGNIWAGTGIGVCKIVRVNDTFSVNIFGKSDGLIGLESNSNAAFADEKGRLWFGTTEGVSVYLPKAKPVEPRAVSIVLESVRLFGGKQIDSAYYNGAAAWYDVPQNLHLPYRFNNLNFSFQAVTLSPTDKILYRYVLEGSAIDRSEWTEDNTVNFSALEPGTYTLKVYCKINGRVQNVGMPPYRFTIETPFHKSIWFAGSLLLFAVLIGVSLQYGANIRKQNRLRREDDLRREEQSKVRERTAEDFHDEVGNRLTRINVLTNVLRSKVGSASPDAERIIRQIQENTRQLYDGTRDILWSLQPSNDNLLEILLHVRNMAVELYSETEVSFNLSGLQDKEDLLRDYKMPLDKSRNFTMIWKEALNNILKYADAKNVLMEVRKEDNCLKIRLTDNGRGFAVGNVSAGNGLKNMHARAKRLDAEFSISSGDKGTSISLLLPLNYPL